MNCPYTLVISHSEYSYLWTTSHTEYETIFCVGKWSHWDSGLQSMANWHCYLGSHPLWSLTCCYSLWAAAVQRPSRQHREERWSLHHLVIKDPWGAHIRSQASLLLYDRNLAKHTFSFLTVLLRQNVGCGVCPYIHIFGLFQSILNRAARIIFIDHKSDQVTPLLSHCT